MVVPQPSMVHVLPLIGTVSALQESLQRTQSVEAIQRLSEKGDNEKVVELLLQTFEQPQQKTKVSHSPR